MPRRCLIEMDDGRWVEGMVMEMRVEQRMPSMNMYDPYPGGGYSGRMEMQVDVRLLVVDSRQPDDLDVQEALAAVKADYRIPEPVAPPGFKPEPEPEPEPEPALRRFSELETDEE